MRFIISALVLLVCSLSASASEIKHDYVFKWNGKTTTVYVSNAGMQDAYQCRWVYKDGDTYRAQLKNAKGDFWSVPVAAVARIEGDVLAGEPERDTSPCVTLSCQGGVCKVERKDSKKTK